MLIYVIFVLLELFEFEWNKYNSDHKEIATFFMRPPWFISIQVNAAIL